MAVASDLRGQQPASAEITVLRSGALYLLAALLGLAVGTAVAFDHVVSLLDPIREYGRRFPYLLTVALAGAMVMLGALILSGPLLFRKRYAAWLAMLLVSGAVGGVNFGPLDLTDLAILAGIAIWLATALVERHPIRIPLPLLFAVMLLIACSLASIVNGGFGSFLSQRTFVNKCVLLLAITSILATTDLSEFAAKLLAALAVMSALLAIGGLVVYFTTGITLTAEDLVTYQYKETPLGVLPRATALMPTTQSLAHLLLLGLSLLLFIPIRPSLRVVGVGLICVAISVTFSTGAGIAMAVVLGIWPFLRWPERSFHFIAILVGLVAVAYFSGAISWTYDTVLVPLGAKGALDRVGYLRAGYETIREHPVFGIGLKQIGRSLPTVIHNAYIQLTAELGIFAGVLFTGLVVSLAIGAWHAACRRTTGSQQMIMKGLFLGMIALAVHFCAEPFYDNYLSWAFLGIVAGAIAGLPRSSAHRSWSWP